MCQAPCIFPALFGILGVIWVAYTYYLSISIYLSIYQFLSNTTNPVSQNPLQNPRPPAFFHSHPFQHGHNQYIINTVVTQPLLTAYNRPSNHNRSPHYHARLQQNPSQRLANTVILWQGNRHPRAQRPRHSPQSLPTPYHQPMEHPRQALQHSSPRLGYA